MLRDSCGLVLGGATTDRISFHTYIVIFNQNSKTYIMLNHEFLGNTFKVPFAHLLEPIPDILLDEFILFLRRGGECSISFLRSFLG